MTDQAPAIEGAASVSERGSMGHLLWFFALVYVVEGLGQIGGLISQPLNYYLKQVQGWTPLQITAYLTLFNLPWINKAPLRPCVRFHSAVRLSSQKLSSYRQCRRQLRLSFGDPAHRAGPVGLRADAYRVRDGDFQYFVRSGLGGEWSASQREWDVHQPTMALVQHSSYDRRYPRWSTRPEATANGRSAQRGGLSQLRSIACDLWDCVSHPREKSSNEHSGHETYVRRTIEHISATSPVDHRGFYIPLLFQSGIEHSPVLHHD